MDLAILGSIMLIINGRPINIRALETAHKSWNNLVLNQLLLVVEERASVIISLKIAALATSYS